MNFKITEVRQHFDISSDDSKSYISFLLIPESNTYQLEVDDKNYGFNDFNNTMESKDKKVSCYLNIFDNEFLGGDRKKESNVKQEVMGVLSVSNFSHGEDISLFYQVYVNNSVYESILSSTRFSLPKGCSFWIEDKNGEHFNDKWVKNQDSRYEKVNILQFHLFNDFDNHRPKI